MRQIKQKLETYFQKLTYRTVKKGILLAASLFLLLSLIQYGRSIHSLDTLTLGQADFLSSGEQNGALLQDLSERFFVKKGFYKYTVTYTADGVAGSFLWPFSTEEYFNAFEQAVTFCQNGTHTNTDSFWVNADLFMTLRLYYDGEGQIDVTSFTLRETDALANRELFGAILLVCSVLFALLLYEYHRSHPERTDLAFLLSALAATVILCSFPAFFPTVANGNDTGFHLTRIQGLADGIRAGQFPVRINPAFYIGYGYADTEYYGSLLLYLPALLLLCGFRLSASYNIFLIFLNLLTVGLSYLAFSKLSKDRFIGLTGAFLYAMSPYRITCMYYRSAVGEVSAMAFLPMLVYGLWTVYSADVNEKKYRFSFVPVVIGLSGLIQTHLLSCEIAGGVIALTCILLLKRTLQPRRFGQLALSVIVTALLNLWFLLPLLDSMLNQTVVIDVAGTNVQGFQKTGLYFSQLFTVFPIYSLITTAASDELIYRDELPLILGIVFLPATALFLGTLTEDSLEKRTRKAGLFVLFLGVLTAWMSTIYFPWDRVCNMHPLFRKLITTLQFAWRFLSISTAFFTFVAVLALIALKRRSDSSCKTAMAAFCLLAMLTPVTIMEHGIQSQTRLLMNDISDLGYSTAAAVYSAEYTLLDTSWDVITTIQEPRMYGGAEISGYQKNGTTVDFQVESSGENGYVLLPLLAYRGYGAKGDSAQISSKILSAGEYKVLQVNLPAGYTGKIHVCFKGFWYWRAAELISLLTLIALCAWGITQKRRAGRA